jgi:hypothetical protein
VGKINEKNADTETRQEYEKLKDLEKELDQKMVEKKTAADLPLTTDETLYRFQDYENDDDDSCGITYSPIDN